MIEQTSPPNPGSPWNPKPADPTGYVAPDRSRPALSYEILNSCELSSTPVVTVIGTVRNEAVPWERSWGIWSRQHVPDWLTVQYLVLDDGSDHDQTMTAPNPQAFPVKYVRLRKQHTPERSCTLAFNHAIRHLVKSPLVLIQWWDRIPGSFDHLAQLVEPHRHRAGIVTSATSRHIGASSSVKGMAPAVLQSHLDLVDWRDDPSSLERIAGPIGGHCVPGQASESSGFCIAADELIALGGYDERYQTRHGYPNVDLWRRMLGSGLTAVFPGVQNHHQSHGAGDRGHKRTDLLADTTLLRNGGPSGKWGEG